MKKIFKKFLWGIAIVIVILVIIVVGFFLKMKSEVKTMKVNETKELITNIFSIKDSFVNLYLIKDSNNYVAIDAGIDMENVTKEIQKLNINPFNVTAVFLTHTDKDHVAAIKL